MASNMEKAITLMVRTNMTQREIAKEIDVSEETISRWKKKKEFNKQKLEEERIFLGDLSSKSIQTMEKLLNARSELVRFNAAKDILDRTGHKPIDKQQIQNIEVPTFIDDISGDEDG